MKVIGSQSYAEIVNKDILCSIHVSLQAKLNFQIQL